MHLAVLKGILITRQRSAQDIALIERAYAFAEHAHRGQKRMSGDPYIIHPLATARRLAHMQLDPPTIAAALLHDVCEDTQHSLADIKREFGEEIAFIVSGVTKLNNLRYRGAERSAESLRKMFLAIAEDIRIVLLKLVDRLHNMETLSYLPPEKQKRIALETLEIYAPLAYRLGIGELKGQLEDLAFPYVYPREHEWLIRTLGEHFNDRRAYVERIKPMIATELATEGIIFLDIHARAKHQYSLYKKLIKRDMDISKVFDLVALRIIVANEDECYSGLGVIHKLWRPLPGLVKDYIALPKPNGYRSLHTTVFGPETRTVEFQLRTQAMHEEAENGIAAHWAYAEQKNNPSIPRTTASFAAARELKWIQQLRDWQKNFTSPKEFLEGLKIDFFKDRIFVLTPKGDAIDLPEGATPIDFAFQIHTAIGGTAVGAKINGRMVPLDYNLKNGEVVEILTQKHRTPNADWLTFVKSAGARKKITSFVKRAREDARLASAKGDSVEIRLIVRDRIGLLRDISQVFARQKINMKNVVTEERTSSWSAIVVQAHFKARANLEKIMIRLKEIKGITEVSYKLL